MEKNIPVKSIRRYAAVLTLVVIALVLLVPYARAKYVGYAEFVDPDGEVVDEIDTGISGISNDDLSALFTLMMNEKYPVGSIFMTVDPSMNTAGAVEAHFGGGWEPWGQGRVPVGVNRDGDTLVKADADAIETLMTVNPAAPETGGTMGGGTGNAAVSLTGTVTGAAPALSAKTFSLSGGGLAFTANSGAITLDTPTTFQGTATPWGVDQMPQHNHNINNTNNGAVTWATSHNSRKQRAIGSSSPQWALGHQSAGSPSSHIWTLEIFDRGGPLTLNFPINLTNAARLHAPTSATLGHPGYNITQQTVDAISLGFSGTSIDIPDNTLQPYFTCYMYRRTALA